MSKLTEKFADWVLRSPGALAVVSADETVTYQDLDSLSTRVANELSRRGVETQHVVAVALDRSVAMIVSWLAIAKLHAVYLPVDPRDLSRRTDYMLTDSGASLVISSTGLSHSRQVGIPDVAYDLLLSESSQRLPAPALVGDDGALPLYVNYTSGSTGRPKGVVISQRSVEKLVSDTTYVELDASVVVAHSSTPLFDAATFEVWGPLLNGATVALPQDQVSAALGPSTVALARGRPTALFLTTALFSSIARHAPAKLHGIDTVLFGGELADVGAVRSLLDSGYPGRLVHMYGPTEATTFTTFWTVDRDADLSAMTVLPVGAPIRPDVSVRIVGPDGTPVPNGAEGELYISGVGLALGYVGRADDANGRFLLVNGQRAYRTGDRARNGPYGYEILGRFDNQLKIRGNRIEPGEIEQVLLQHERVEAAIVVAAGSGPARKHLAAFLLVRGDAVDVDEVSRFISERLPIYMVPNRYILVDTLPLTPTGKVDRKRLTDRLARGRW